MGIGIGGERRNNLEAFLKLTRPSRNSTILIKVHACKYWNEYQSIKEFKQMYTNAKSCVSDPNLIKCNICHFLPAILCQYTKLPVKRNIT